MKRFSIVVLLLMATAVAFAAENLSIQQFFQTSPKVTTPTGQTRMVIIDGSTVKQMAYSSVKGQTYTLPAATVSTLGGIKVGTGLSVTADGTLNNTGVAGVASFEGRGGAVTGQAGDYSIAEISGAATVASTGSYTDLINKPTIPAAQVSSDWNSYTSPTQILNKPTIPTALSQLTEDATHRTVTDAEKTTWNSNSSPVNSVFGRTGAITAQSGDYTAAMVGADALGSATSVQANLNTHTGNVSNPHAVTKTQVGLGSVDNTSDAAKPVSTATQTALDLKHNISAFNIYSTAQGAKDAAQDAAIAGKEPADTTIIKESELSSATNSASTTTAANSAAVKSAYDLAAGKLPVNAPSSTGLAQIGGAPMYPDDGEIKDATYGYAYNLKSGSGTSASPSTGAQAAFYVEKYAGYNGLTSDLSRGAAHFRTIKKTGATNMSGLMSSFSLNGGTGDSSNLFLHSVLRSPLAASPAGSFYGAWNYVRNQAGAGSGHMANVEFDMGEDATTNDAGHYQDHLTWAGPNKNFSSHIWGSVITTQNVTMGMGLLGGKGYGKYHTGWYTDTDTIVPTAGGRNEVFFPRGGTTAGNAYTIMRAGPDYYTDGIDLSAATLSGSAIKLAPSQTISDGTVTKTLAQLAAGGTGLTDGDKVDITVTGSGATWTIDANSVALGTDTTGDYVSGATTGGGLAKTGTEGATLGLAACASGQIYKYNGTAWACAADDSGTGSGTVSSGIAGQLAYYAASGTTVSGTTALPDGTTATTQTAGDNSTKVATTAYVATAVAGAGGGNMSTSTWDVDSNGAIDLAKGGTNATTAADAATALGLGTTSAVTHASVTVTGPTTDAPTIKDLAVHNITSAGKSMMQIQPSFVPSQAFTGSLYGLLFIPSLGGTNSYTMGDVFGIYSRVDTGSGFSGILNSSNGVYIGNGSKGNAGAAVNSARGIWIANLSQGTANYGIQSDMAAGAGKWFLYGNGAAASFLAGGLQVGGTATDVGAGNIKADNFIISGYEEKTTSYTVSKDSSKITLASGTATVTLPASIPAGDVSVVVTVAGAAASGVSFAATGGSISWGDAGAPAFTNSKTADVVCHSQNTAATTTAAWRCVKGGNF